MSLHRTRPLPIATSRGRLVVPEHVVANTQTILRRDGSSFEPHKSLVWWLGRQVEDDTIVLASYRPSVRSGPAFVFADEAAVGAGSRRARQLRLGIVAQVHSHPGVDTRHSDGDDDLVLMAFEGMFSLVIAEYGRGSMYSDLGAGLHQFQDGHWAALDDASSAFIVVPTEVQP